MKQKFLALVKEVKETRIVQALYESSNKKELKEAWEKFCKVNEKLVEKIKNWGEEYYNCHRAPIFKDGEKIDNAMEIVVIIYIIDDESISEVQIFENWPKLVKSIKRIKNDFAQRIACLINDEYICNIEAEKIFSFKEDIE